MYVFWLWLGQLLQVLGQTRAFCPVLRREKEAWILDQTRTHCALLRKEIWRSHRLHVLPGRETRFLVSVFMLYESGRPQMLCRVQSLLWQTGWKAWVRYIVCWLRGGRRRMRLLSKGRFHSILLYEMLTKQKEVSPCYGKRFITDIFGKVGTIEILPIRALNFRHRNYL